MMVLDVVRALHVIENEGRERGNESDGAGLAEPRSQRPEISAALSLYKESLRLRPNRQVRGRYAS